LKGTQKRPTKGILRESQSLSAFKLGIAIISSSTSSTKYLANCKKSPNYVAFFTSVIYTRLERYQHVKF
jgi:hypothetical protein